MRGYRWVAFLSSMLPSRDPKIPWFTDGSSLSLRDAHREEKAPPILPV
ncbi:MAG: hypothetical protein HYZ72_09285 [Deltaproteobacteria bacterium]|nr:hypothetical protein [Deltaproteobacteria bacterium]